MLKILTSPLVSIGAAALTVVLSALLLVAKIDLATQARQINRLKVDVATAESNYSSCKTNRVMLGAALSQCNVAAQNTANVANIVAKAGVEAVKSVQKNRPRVDVNLGQIRAMPTATCDDALAVLKQGAQ